MKGKTVTVTLRPATNADAADVQEIMFSALAEFGYASEPHGYDIDRTWQSGAI